MLNLGEQDVCHLHIVTVLYFLIMLMFTTLNQHKHSHTVSSTQILVSGLSPIWARSSQGSPWEPPSQFHHLELKCGDTTFFFSFNVMCSLVCSLRWHRCPHSWEGWGGLWKRRGGGGPACHCVCCWCKLMQPSFKTKQPKKKKKKVCGISVHYE